MSAEALTWHRSLAPHLTSYRLVNHLETLVQYLAIGRRLDEYGQAYKRMGRALRAGSADWYRHGEAHFERSGTELWLNDRAYRAPTPSLLDTDLELRVEASVTAPACAMPADEVGLGALGELLPLLAASTPVASYRSLLSDKATALLRTLLRLDLLQASPARSEALKQTPAGVRWLGHFGVELSAGGRRIWVDPALALRHRRLGVAEALRDPPDAVVLCSSRADQCHFDTLLQLPRDTEIIIPASTRGPTLDNVHLAEILAQLGFTRVRGLGSWESIGAPELRLTALPYRGDALGADAHADRLILHVGMGDRGVLLAHHAGADRRGGLLPILHRVRKTLAPVALLFVSYAENWRPLALFTRRPFYLGPGVEPTSASATDILGWSRALGVSKVVPYGGLAYTRKDLLQPPPRTKLYAGFERRGSVARLAAHLKGQAEVLLPTELGQGGL